MCTSHISESQPATKPPPPGSPSAQYSTDKSYSPLGPTIDPRGYDSDAIELSIHSIKEKLTIGDEICYYSRHSNGFKNAWILAIDPELDAPLKLSTSEVVYKHDNVCLIQPRQETGSNRCPLKKMFRIEQYQTKKEGDMNDAMRQSLELQKKQTGYKLSKMSNSMKEKGLPSDLCIDYRKSREEEILRNVKTVEQFQDLQVYLSHVC